MGYPSSVCGFGGRVSLRQTTGRFPQAAKARESRNTREILSFACFLAKWKQKSTGSRLLAAHAKREDDGRSQSRRACLPGLEPRHQAKNRISGNRNNFFFAIKMSEVKTVQIFTRKITAEEVRKRKVPLAAGVTLSEEVLGVEGADMLRTLTM